LEWSCFLSRLALYVHLPWDSHTIQVLWVLTNIWLKLLVLSSWSGRKSPLVLAWKHLYSMVLHVPMQFLKHTNSHFLSTIYKYFSFPSFIPWSSTLFCWKEEVGRGESRNKNIYFHKTKSPLIKERNHSSRPCYV